MWVKYKWQMLLVHNAMYDIHQFAEHGPSTLPISSHSN